jgi:hypothetical protein
MAPVTDIFKHTHIHNSELKCAAALVPNQFWHHSAFIVHNYVVTYATKTSHCKQKPSIEAPMQWPNVDLLNFGKPEHWEKLYIYWYGVLCGTTTMNLKCGKIINWGSFVPVIGAISGLLPKSAQEALVVSCVGCNRVCHTVMMCLYQLWSEHLSWHFFILNNCCKINKILKSLFTVVFSDAAYGKGVTLPETGSGS